MAVRHVYPFEKLRVWQSARSLIKNIYRTTKSFPRSEIYGLTSQANRAAVSVAANLAEGASRTSRKDQAHFSQIAYGSLMELACLQIVAVDLEFLAADRESILRSEIELVSRQLNALRASQVSSS
ncbi:MAG TPA: four helix bundle protein [Chthoniobacterales bacterium]|nr:four helix bundle protein [Chthoniobacterales bacterium]